MMAQSHDDALMIRRLLGKFVCAGLVRSVRGSSGGFILARPAKAP